MYILRLELELTFLIVRKSKELSLELPSQSEHVAEILWDIISSICHDMQLTVNLTILTSDWVVAKTDK